MMIYFVNLNLQYDIEGRITELEKNMAMVQQRHMEQAGIDSSWNEENYTIPEYTVSVCNFFFRFRASREHNYITEKCM